MQSSGALTRVFVIVTSLCSCNVKWMQPIFWWLSASQCLCRYLILKIIIIIKILNTEIYLEKKYIKSQPHKHCVSKSRRNTEMKRFKTIVKLSFACCTFNFKFCILFKLFNVSFFIRAHWLKHNTKEAESVYNYVAQIFNIWSKSMVRNVCL